MSTPARLVGFLLALLVVFIAARGVGAAIGPVSPPPPAHEQGEDHPRGDAA